MLLRYSPALTLGSVFHLGTLESTQDIPSWARTPGSSSQGEGSTLPTTLLQQSPQLRARPSLKTSRGAQPGSKSGLPHSSSCCTHLPPQLWALSRQGDRREKNVHIKEAPCGFGTGSNTFMGTERWPQ